MAAGAFAAFLATSSGLLVSIAGVLSTDVLRGRVRDFRLAALVGGLVPIPLALAASSAGLVPQRRTGVRGRRVHVLPAAGAGHLVARADRARARSAGCSSAACCPAPRSPLAVTGGIDDELLGGWPAVLIGYPAAVTVPVAFLTMVGGRAG